MEVCRYIFFRKIDWTVGIKKVTAELIRKLIRGDVVLKRNRSFCDTECLICTTDITDLESAQPCFAIQLVRNDSSFQLKDFRDNIIMEFFGGSVEPLVFGEFGSDDLPGCIFSIRKGRKHGLLLIVNKAHSSYTSNSHLTDSDYGYSKLTKLTYSGVHLSKDEESIVLRKTLFRKYVFNLETGVLKPMGIFKT